MGTEVTLKVVDILLVLDSQQMIHELRIYWDFQTDTIISGVYREQSQKGKISNKLQLCGGKCLTEVEGQRSELEVWFEAIEKKQ